MKLPYSALALCSLIVIVAGGYAPPSYADGNVATMAGIVLTLQHFPSDADKETLAGIANGDGSAEEKAVASAIAGIQHKVTASDQTALQAIAADENQPADLRELASIVAGINHVPGADAKAELAKLAGG